MSHRSRPFVSSRRQFRTLLGSVGASTLTPRSRRVAAAAPSGRIERLTDVPIDRYVTIVEGQGHINA